MRTTMKRLLTILLGALALTLAAPMAHAEEGDVRALYWNCAAVSTLLIQHRSFGQPMSQKNGDMVADLVAKKFAKEEGTTPGLARGRMRRAMRFYGSPTGVENECLERGWLYTDATSHGKVLVPPSITTHHPRHRASDVAPDSLAARAKMSPDDFMKSLNHYPTCARDANHQALPGHEAACDREAGWR